MSEKSEIPATRAEQKISLAKRIAKKATLLALAASTGLIPDRATIPNTITESPHPPPPAGQEMKEQLRQLPANVVVIDFAPNEPKEGINQTTFPDQNLIDSIDIPPEVKDYIINRFGIHGESVISVMRKVWGRFGFTSTPDMYPLQNALSAQNIELTQDELGNQEYFLSINPDQITKILQQYPDQKVVNLSWQLGKVGISMVEHERRIVKPVDYPAYVTLPDGRVQYYSTTHELITQTKEEFEDYERHLEEEASEIVTLLRPDPRPKEAYSKDEVQQNLPKLFALCNAFPDKLFIAAAGNEGENLEIMQNRPTNLLLVAEWNGVDKRPQYNVLGADIYVDNEELSIKHGGSFSIPVLTALGSIFSAEGLNAQEAKKKIQRQTNTETFLTSSGEKKVNVFNPQSILVSP